jgi:hypothetical protein
LLFEPVQQSSNSSIQAIYSVAARSYARDRLCLAHDAGAVLPVHGQRRPEGGGERHLTGLENVLCQPASPKLASPVAPSSDDGARLAGIPAQPA